MSQSLVRIHQISTSSGTLAGGLGHNQGLYGDKFIQFELPENHAPTPLEHARSLTSQSILYGKQNLQTDGLEVSITQLEPQQNPWYMETTDEDALYVVNVLDQGKLSMLQRPFTER